MAPENDEQRRLAVSEDEDGDSQALEQPQYLYIIRHGDRWDYENPDWTKTSSRPGDPPLSQLGHQQARETGLLLDELFREDGIASVQDITWLSSPFLRCLQTSTEALNALTDFPEARKIPILPEYSVFEWDAKGSNWHDSLPPLSERIHYFPRLDLSYQSLFVPTLPEPTDVFHARCDRAMTALSKRFTFRPKTALVVVTHAAACIGLAAAATNLTVADINPAAPCGVYRLTRTGAQPDVWKIDAADADAATSTSDSTGAIKRNLNGHTAHLSNMSGKTIAWNHFGPKNVHRGYTGPPTSRFAPPEIREEL